MEPPHTMHSLHLTPDCGPDVQNPTQALGRVKHLTGVLWYIDSQGIFTSGSIFIHGILTPPPLLKSVW